MKYQEPFFSYTSVFFSAAVRIIELSVEQVRVDCSCMIIRRV